MDVLAVVFFSVLSAGTTGVLVTVNRRRAAQPFPRRRDPVLYTKYLLPEPGTNFELYTRAKEVMDGLVSDKTEALTETKRIKRLLEESDAALEDSQSEITRLEAENASLRSENEMLVGKIETAQEIVRSFTHSKMKLFREQEQPRRQRLLHVI